MNTEQRSGRFFYMDLMRLLSFAMIVIYHFIAELFGAGHFSNQALSLFYNQNCNYVMISVSMFFILSGAGLTLSLEDKKQIDWRAFYKKRFFKLLVPFYIAYTMTFVSFLIRYRSLHFFAGVKWWRILFTITGTDGYMAILGQPSFYLAVGEWFLGCLVVMYLFFPLFFKALKKNATVFLLFAVLCYVVLMVTYRWKVLPHENLFVKLFDFLMGMFLIDQRDRFKKWHLAILLPVVFVGLTGIVRIPLHTAVNSAIMAIGIFLVAAICLRDLPRTKVTDALSSFSAHYTYEIYLIHHAVILMLAGELHQVASASRMLFWFFITSLLIGVAAAAIKIIENQIRRWISY